MSEAYIGGGLCCCVLCFAVFLIVFISSSLSSVETTQWALKYDWWSESVDEQVITTPGLHWVGMGNYLLHYPNVNKNVYFRSHSSNFGSPEDIVKGPVQVRTLDGLSIELELEFTYQLQPEKLRELYYLVGGDWSELLVQLSMSVIDNHACHFTAQEFYLNRTLIQTTFVNQLRTTLSNELYINLKTMQLQPAHFPSAYSHAIKLTQYYNTDIEVAVQEQKTVIIQKQSDKKVAQVLAQKTVIEAEAQAAKITANNQAEVSQFIYQQEKQADAYKNVLGFFYSVDGNSGAAIGSFDEYLKVRALQEHDVAHTAVKVP